jgi:sulfur carrier protein
MLPEDGLRHSRRGILMFVIVNGHELRVPDQQTLRELLSLLSPTAPFAVAHNEEFVPQANYGECRICPGDRIDVVSPMAGG